MSRMQFQIRKMQQNDAEQLQKIYQSFVSRYVGPSERKFTVFRRMARKQDKYHWVALDTQGKIVGYISSKYVKGKRQGRINETVVDPNCDFEKIARLLVDKVYNIFLEEGAASVHVSTVRNPHYKNIFPKLGFFHVETDAVFMLAIHDVPRFLDEVTPILIRRLGRLQNWDGWLQVNCGGHNKFFRKEGESVQCFFWTNYEVDLKIILEPNVLADLLLGIITIQEAMEQKRLQLETALRDAKTNDLLTTIFPKTQFLAFNFW